MSCSTNSIDRSMRYEKNVANSKFHRKIVVSAKEKSAHKYAVALIGHGSRTECSEMFSPPELLFGTFPLPLTLEMTVWNKTSKNTNKMPRIRWRLRCNRYPLSKRRIYRGDVIEMTSKVSSICEQLSSGWICSLWSLEIWCGSLVVSRMSLLCVFVWMNAMKEWTKVPTTSNQMGFNECVALKAIRIKMVSVNWIPADMHNTRTHNPMDGPAKLLLTLKTILL